MKKGKQTQIALIALTVLIASMTLNAVAKEVPAQLQTPVTGDATEVSLAGLFRNGLNTLVRRIHVKYSHNNWYKRLGQTMRMEISQRKLSILYKYRKNKKMKQP